MLTIGGLASEHPDVHIEVVAGTQQGSWDLPCEEHRFDDVLHPGCSIGIEGLDTCCSLSGLVRVTMPNDYTGVYGLMSHYMAGYGRRNRMLPIREEEQVRILSPARTDHETTMDALESYLPSGVKDMTRGRRDMNTWPAQEVVQHGEPNAYTESKKQLDDLLGEIHACNSRWLATRQLGPVCLSSGAKVPPPNTPMMDWALIDLEKSRIPGPGLISEAVSHPCTPNSVNLKYMY